MVVATGVLSGLGAAQAGGGETPAQQAIRLLIQGRGGDCGVAFDGFSPYPVNPRDGGAELPAELRAEITYPGLTSTHWSRWRVESNLAVTPIDPVAGEIARSCGRVRAPKQDLDWLALPYFDGGSLDLYAGRRWRGGREMVRQSATRLEPDQNNSIWAKRCTRKPQKVSFTRRFYSSAPANSGSRPFFAVDDYIQGSEYEYGAIKWVKAFLNGSRVGKAKLAKGQSGQFQLAPTVFNAGLNSARVVAKKGRTGKCNPRRQGKKDRRLGLQIRVSAYFSADLEVTRTKTSGDGVAGPHTQRLTLTNKGPSAVMAGQVEFETTTADAKYEVEIRGGPKSTTCPNGVGLVRHLSRDPAKQAYTCTFGKLGRGESATWTVTTTAVLEDGDKIDYVRLKWAAMPRGMGDPVFDNSRGAATAWFCPQSEIQRCKNAAGE